ncbi:hypothetical protein BKA70DRAFT_1445696 [Coprinopsis sp. MPI-PUGE-AT-0042]|nr:hypothetical protein BKA70DRAFT_1445696 [Coprinopsis sp. MPI-PUGE-AT-0042]
MVGIVCSERLNVDAVGNFNLRFTPLKKAKFQLSITSPPPDSEFHAHFAQGMTYLQQLEGSVSKTLDNRKFLRVVEGGEGGVEAIRLSQDIFERRTAPLDMHDTRDASINWRVPDVRRNLLDIAPYFAVRPMLAYNMNDNLIDPAFMANTLSGAMVEVSFWVRHMSIKETDGLVDVFSGMFEQIRVIQPAPTSTQSPFRQNAAAGPLVGGVRVPGTGG